MKYIIHNETEILNIVEDDSQPENGVLDTPENRVALQSLQNFEKFFPSSDDSAPSAESIVRTRVAQGRGLWDSLQVDVTLFNDTLNMTQEDVMQLFQISDVLEKSLRAGALSTATYVLNQLKVAMPQYESIADDYIGRISAILS